MPKYAMFRFAPDGEPTGSPVIFVENAEGVTRYSLDKEEDKFFAEWYKKASAGIQPVKRTFMDYIGYNRSYHQGEIGEYEGEAKKRVDAEIAKLRRGKVKIVES